MRTACVKGGSADGVCGEGAGGGRVVGIQSISGAFKNVYHVFTIMLQSFILITPTW